jgi:hypothetical protein
MMQQIGVIVGPAGDGDHLKGHVTGGLGLVWMGAD